MRRLASDEKVAHHAPCNSSLIPASPPLLHGCSVFIVHEGGRPNGIAFVELPTAQECTACMVKNKQMMGSRYVEIFPANKGDLEKYRARQF